eukprot:c9238_g1_i1.p1 GENE.c9238_g1_i1~~c9238_g1_i1.p1  ORF type:complete len:148 (-),score=30.91 c9238_g1_i1:69-482(-)
MSAAHSNIHLPGYCLAAALAGIGSAAVATAIHPGSCCNCGDASEANIPQTCIGSSLIGIGALAAAAVHHGVPQHIPTKECVLGIAVGAATLAVAVSAHKKHNLSKRKYKVMPWHCIVGSVGVAALTIATALVVSKRK